MKPIHTSLKERVLEVDRDPDGQHWRRLKEEAPALAKAGVTGPWLPPASGGGIVTSFSPGFLA